MAYKIGDKVATRVAYGDALVKFGENPNVVVLDADLAKSTNTNKFAEKYPDRFFDCGIAEANMACVAAGFASTGKIPFISTFAMFAAGRAFEQVRNSIAYPGLPVKIGATHAGISVGEDGASHQAIEDVALMRSIPGMVVLSPADAVETEAAVAAAIAHNGPVYLRLGRLNVPVLFDADSYQFTLGKGITVRDGNDVTVVATGLMLEKSIAAAELLAADGINARVINIHTIKPLDAELILKAAKETGGIVVAEEHSVIGGLGSAVADVVTEHCPVPVKKVGVQDVFGASGKPDLLLEHYGLTAAAIVEKAKGIAK